MHTKGQYIMYQSTYRQARRRFYSIIKKICECWNGIVRIDVPHSQFTFRQFLQTENFQETLLSPLMIKMVANFLEIVICYLL